MSIEMVIANNGVAFHTSVVRSDRPIVSLIEPGAPVPTAPSLEVRSPGLWTDIGIQTPFEHVSVDIEAFAVALEDPDEASADAFGERVALGGELEWETDGPIALGPAPRSYEVPCVVHGELLVADEVIEIDGFGWRSHRWGSQSDSPRTAWRARSTQAEWLIEQRAPTDYAVIARAPIPDPAVPDARLEQALIKSSAGALGWLRTRERTR